MYKCPKCGNEKCNIKYMEKGSINFNINWEKIDLEFKEPFNTLKGTEYMAKKEFLFCSCQNCEFSYAKNIISDEDEIDFEEIKVKAEEGLKEIVKNISISIDDLNSRLKKNFKL